MAALTTTASRVRLMIVTPLFEPSRASGPSISEDDRSVNVVTAPKRIDREGVSAGKIRTRDFAPIFTNRAGPPHFRGRSLFDEETVHVGVVAMPLSQDLDGKVAA